MSILGFSFGTPFGIEGPLPEPSFETFFDLFLLNVGDRGIRFANASTRLESRTHQVQDIHGSAINFVIVGGMPSDKSSASGVACGRYTKTPSRALRPDGRGIDQFGNERFA